MKSLLSIGVGGFTIHAFNLLIARRLVPALLGYGVLAANRPVSAADCVAPPSGLVSWWRAESNALDSAGSNQGTLANGTTYAAGAVGQGFSFDGINDSVQIPRFANLDVGNQVTVEFWMKADASNAMDSYQGLVTSDFFGVEIANGYAIGPLGVNFFISTDGGASVSSSSYPDTATVNGGGAVIAAGQWHHVAGTYDGTKLQLYVDGQPWGNPNFHTGAISPMRTESFVTIGAEDGRTVCPVCVGNRYFNGLIDEPAIYNQALSAAEVQAIYTAGSAGKCVVSNPPPPACESTPAGLVSWWRAERDAADARGSNPGEALNGVRYTNGPVGTAFYFDGVDDRVIVADSTSLHFGPGVDFSVEAWIRPEVAATDFGVQSVVNKRYTPNSFAAVGWEFGLVDGKLACQLADAPLTPGDFSTFASSGPDLRDGNYHHVALSVQRTSATGGKLLVDGQVVLTFDPTVQPGDLGTTEPLRIGAHAQAGLNSHFTGAVDELSIYHRALSVGEISAIYAAGSAGKCLVSNPPPVACVVPPAGLISWWRGENSTADAANGNGGTIAGTGTVTYGPGVVGQAFVFDGTHRDRVNIGNPINLHLEDFTLEAWIRRASPTVTSFDVLGADGSVAGDGAMIFGYGRGGYGFGLANDGRIFLSRIDLDGLFSSPLVTDTNWHHLAVTKSGSNATFYLDGAPQATPAYDHPTHFTFDDATCDCSAAAAIGSRGDGRGGTFFGIIDEPAVFNRALAAAEIQAIYAAGGTGKCQPPSNRATNYLNFNFYAHQSPGGGTIKVGLAATGLTTNDFWNHYSRDDGRGGYLTFGSLTNLKWADGSSSSAGMTIANAPGAYDNGSPDAMYHINLYPFDGGNITVTVTNLPVGQYDLYLYGWDVGIYQLTVGNLDYGTKTNLSPPIMNPQTWQEGQQYVLFRGVQVGLAGQEAVVTVRPGPGGFSLIAGMQIAAVTTTQPSSCTPASSGLTSWWRAEGNALDSADGNIGTLQDGATIASGKVGRAFSFDGVDDFVSVDDAPNLRFGPTSPMTVDLWVFRTSNHPVQHLIGKRDGCTGSPTEGTFQLALNMEDGEGLSFANPSGSCACSGQDLPLNAWTHLAGTFDGTTLRLFINGQLAATTTGSLGPANTAPLKIGDSGSCGAAYGAAFGGLIDEVSIYDRALSTNAIQAIFNAGSMGKCALSSPACVPAPADLVSWWRAQGDATDAVSGLNGTLAAGAGFAAGEVGQAFSLDGVNAHVQIGDRPELVMLSALTVEAWIFPTGAGSGPAGEGILFNKEGEYEMDRLPDGTIRWAIASSNPVWLWTTTPLVAPLNSWTHVALVYDHGVTRIYGNGSLVQSNAGPADLGDIYPTLNDFRIGGRLAISENFQGLIDEVAVFKRALTTSEIAAIYAAGSAGKCVVPKPPAPLVVSQPTNVTVYVGSNATFRVVATGGAPLAYQWRFNGTNLVGKTSSVLSFNGVQLTNAGPYSVLISNVSGSVTSSIAVLTVNPLPDCVAPPAGLVSWWRAEKTAIDDWDSNNGITTRFLATSGKVGSAFAFDGPISFIQVSDSTSLRVTNALTLEAWVYPSSVSGASPRTIISKFDYPIAQPVGAQSAYLLGTTNNGHLFFTVSATGSARTNTTLVTTQSLPISQWTFVVATYDGAALRLYLNGTLATQTNYTGGIFPGGANLSFGAIPSTTPTATSFWPFTGRLDEVSLYNRALTDGEIQAIYNTDVVGKCLVAPSLVTQPEDHAVPMGEDAKFTVSVLGNRPLRYQWRFNGTNLANATNSALVLEKVGPEHVGNYSVFVSNAVGNATSAEAALTLLPPPTCTETPAGLISWWPADGLLADAMGTNNIMTFSPTLYVTGKVDRAFSFNGTSSRVQVNNSPSLNFGSNADFSVETWIKVLPLSGNNLPISGPNSTNTPIIEKRSVSGSTGIGYSLSLNAGRLAFWLGSSPLASTNASGFISNGPDLRDSMFHHVAVSMNRTATNGGKLYVDGELVLAFDATARRGDLSNPSPMLIGAPSSLVTGLFFRGQIDEPAIYSRALTSSEILDLRQAGAAGKCKVKPSILVQPVSQRITIGSDSNVTFSVIATGSPLLRYQWLRNGQGIAGATNSTYATLLPASYSVRVTNLFGSMLSANAALTLNHPPTAYVSGQPLFRPEDTPLVFGNGFGGAAISTGSDEDNDPLTFIIVTPPTHGAITLTASNMIYQPTPDFNGVDSFSYKLDDGLADSNIETVRLNFLPVNDPPVAQSQTIALDEDTAAALTLGALDVDGDPITFTVGAPAHGTLTSAPPNLSYRPNTNYFGPDSFTFRVSDGQMNSETATVSLTIRPVNDTPVAEIVLAPLSHLPGVTNLLVIAPVGTNAVLILDGSRSTDVENDPLAFFWSEGTNCFAAGMLATNRFAAGLHVITLTVSDGQAAGTNSVVLELRSAGQAVGTLIELVANADLGRKNANPLLASLRSAVAAFERGNTIAGINELAAFQNKVRAQIAPLSPELATALIEAAQEIIDAVSAPAIAGAAGYRLAKPTPLIGGKFRLSFNGQHGRTYFIEASTNLVTWEIIGVARDAGLNRFDFDDVHAAQFPGRFYRVGSR